ncbi:MAG: hypothetical protein PHQ52_00675 [Candidatus Omnitrophica bacterium]|nr:hypothetical protein [Candidatus Omnitrophota bacterium]
MKDIFRIYKENKLFKEKDVEKVLDELEKNGFSRINKKELIINEEDRINDKTLELDTKIIDLQSIRITHASIVKFHNCVFIGDVMIYDEEEKLTEIDIDSCIFLKGCKIVNSNKLIDVSIKRSNFSCLTFHIVDVKNVYMMESSVLDLRLEYMNADSFVLYWNNINSLNVEAGGFKEVKFDHSQINIKKSLNRLGRSQKGKGLNRNLFVLTEAFSRNSTQHIKHIENERIKDTLTFI